MTNPESTTATRIAVRAVLFDVGHTILFPDDRFLYTLAVAHGGKMPFADFVLHGARAKEAAYRENPFDPYKRWFAAWMTGAGVPREALPEIYAAVIDRHKHGQLWDTLESSIPEILTELRVRGFTLGIISNADGTIAAMLERFELDHYFSCIIDSGMVGVEKPDARIFLLACKALDIEPAACVYIGDQVSVDMIGASQVSMAAILLDPHDVVNKCPFPKIARLSELLDRLKLLPE